MVSSTRGIQILVGVSRLVVEFCIVLESGRSSALGSAEKSVAVFSVKQIDVEYTSGAYRTSVEC